MKPIIMPFAGVGPVILGSPSKQWLEVRRGDAIVTITRLPGGRCVLPDVSGTIRVHADGEELVSAALDPRLVPTFGPGPYDVRGHGTIYVWQYDGDPNHGLLAGGPPLATGEGSLDLSRLPVPHGSMRLAVQVRAGAIQGPVQFVLYQPSPKPAQVTVDHDVGKLGPRTHLVIDPAGLDQLEVTVERRIRQTRQTVQDHYDITPDANRITFDDLLHGDRLVLSVDAPHALTDAGRPVRDLEYRYHAVPEPRLERDGGGQAVRFEAGIAPLPAGEGMEALRATLGSVHQPTWHEEFPNATRGMRLTALPQALHDAGFTEPLLQAPALRWWLGVLEAGQSINAARQLREQRIVCAPVLVDSVSAAVDRLKEFPVHIFKELDAGPGAAQVIQFQERLGIGDQNGEAVLRIASAVQQDLEAAADAWMQAIRSAGVHWLDGSLAPLDDGPDLDGLRASIIADPAKAMQTIRKARQDIWRCVRSAAATLVAPDVEARKALLAWHLQRSDGALRGLGALFASAGVEAPQITVRDAATLARGLADTMRAADVAIARVHPVPTTGPKFIETAAQDGLDLAKQLHAALAPWAGDKVPPALRLPADRLLAALEPEAIARLAVWRHFLAESDQLVHDVEVLAATPDALGQLAQHVAALLADASERRDPMALAEARDDLARIESGLVASRHAWDHTLQNCSPATLEALGLRIGEAVAWNDVRRLIRADAQTLRELGRFIEGADDARIDEVLASGGELDRLLERIEDAGPDIERAHAVGQYDRFRARLAEWLDADEPISGLRAAYVVRVQDDVAEQLRRHVGRLDEAKQAAIRAFPEFEGTHEVLTLVRYLALADEVELTPEEAVAAAQRAEELLDALDGHAAPWRRIADAVSVRLRAAYPELSRYLGDAAPAWEVLEHPDNAVRWIYAMCTGTRDPVTRTDLATMLPGTRRLVHHTLKERALWLA